MSHFAKIENNIVTQVIVADETAITNFPGTWVQTSYNTRGGVHYGADGQPDGGIALRKNYAGIGYTYDSQADAFYPPRPNNLFQLNTSTGYWMLKPEYSPLVRVVMQSPLTTLPIGIADEDITIDNVVISDNQYVLFPDLTVESGVHKYTKSTGLFTRVPYNDFSVIVIGNDFSVVYKYVNIDWVAQAVLP